MAALWLHTTVLLVLLATWCPSSQGFPAETLCGGELVDALQIVCGERNFFYTARTTDEDPVQPQRQRRSLNIAAMCCFMTCTLSDLQDLCH
ncbi:insulin-like [Betta splendens]|uniref:Insulin-like n=1 Tax=Betta splendens TaxID=158456 RepID=A0A6P7PB69_BETSP|nr:insulin-like [Betta splendens]